MRLMSGHSKWSKVKHQKEVTDAAKGALFTKAAHAITLAVREGGGSTDPGRNVKLRFAIEKARAINMPKEAIDRAIARAAMGKSGESAQGVLYEGYGPAGARILIEVVTDNRNRSTAAVRNVLESGGGGLGSPGSALYAFERRGSEYRANIVVPLAEPDRERLAALVGKLRTLEGVVRVWTNATL